MRKPRFWINPRLRLSFPAFCVEWHLCDANDLDYYDKIYNNQKIEYGSALNSVHIIIRQEYAGIDILYTESTKFENLRLQSWLRHTVRDAIELRAKIVLINRAHELETIHHLYAKEISVRKLRKRILGQCSADNRIKLSPYLVIFPQKMMDGVILHEMAHLKHHHHRKSFWDFLSTLLGEDAKEQNMIQDLALSKYWQYYEYLMK